MGITLKCEFCGKLFKTTNLSKKYCCYSCQHKASYYRNKEKRREYSKEYYNKK